MERQERAPKVAAIYKAVSGFFMEGADLSELTVSQIAARAGIGKGTVYEYFSNKEEMIAEALHSEMQEASRRLYSRLCKKKSLHDKVEMLLLDMERHMREVACVFRIFYTMRENSVIGKKLHQRLREKKDDEMTLLDLIRHMLEDELPDKVKEKEEDVLYLAMNVTSRLLGYAMFLNEDEKALDRGKLRERFCMDICKDVENCR